MGFEIPRLTLKGIKALIGHPGNKLADDTAKKGALELSMSVKINIPLSQTDISNRVKTQIFNKWHLRWTINKQQLQTH